MANLLDWHRREAKADWWEYFRLKDLTDEDLFDERCAISGLKLVETIRGPEEDPDGSLLLRQTGDRCSERRRDLPARRKDRRSGRDRPSSADNRYQEDEENGRRTPDVGICGPERTKHRRLADALFRLGAWVEANGVDSPGAHRAARDLLRRQSPRLTNGDGTLMYTANRLWTLRSE